jgi:hypothetical protein
MNPRMIAGIAAVALFTLGFADLMAGGITASAICLTLAYCVFVPAYIWLGGDRASATVPAAAQTPDKRPSYLAAAIAAAAVLVLYLITLSPGTAMWDASEYIAAAHTFGIPHPPGNPFFVVIGRFFAMLPLPVGVAARINILAALCSGVAAFVWFLITERVVSTWLVEKWQRITAAAAAALVGSTAFTVWTQSVVNEKVYTLSLAGLAIVSWLAIRWVADPRGAKADQLLILVAYVCGLGYANHTAGVLAAPAVALAVALRQPRALLRPKFLAALAAAFVVGVSPFITQPIRAGHNPPINEGGVTACTTQFALSCTFSKTTFDRFMYNFNRGQYSKPSVMERQAPFGAQLDMWWLYFKWQWLRDPFGERAPLQLAFALAFLALGLFGGYKHFRSDPATFAYFGPLVLLLTLGLIIYLNFKYGASQAPHLGDTVPREVRDRDYFYLWSFSAWSVWVGVGLAALWSALSARTTWLRASPVYALAVVPLFANFAAATRHDDDVTASWARDLLNTVEPYGVLIVAGDNDTFPLWYAQEVEHVRRDVVVANTSLLQTDWHPRQILMRPVFEYDAQRGPAMYRGGAWVKPPGPPMKLTLEEVDAVSEFLTPVQPMQFDAHGISATINPADLDYGVIKKNDLLVLRMIRDAFTERPIYFSRSTGDYPRSLGLARYLTSHGLADRLEIPDTTQLAAGSSALLADMGLIDLPRATTLWMQVYEGPHALKKKGRWVDEPSINIPLLYVALGSELMYLHHQQGRVAVSDSIYQTTLDVARATSIPEVAARLEASRPRQ